MVTEDVPLCIASLNDYKDIAGYNLVFLALGETGSRGNGGRGFLVCDMFSISNLE